MKSAEKKLGRVSREKEPRKKFDEFTLDRFKVGTSVTYIIPDSNNISGDMPCTGTVVRVSMSDSEETMLVIKGRYDNRLCTTPPRDIALTLTTITEYNIRPK